MKQFIITLFVITSVFAKAYEYPAYQGYFNDFENLLPKMPTYFMSFKVEKKMKQSQRRLILITTPTFGDKSNSKDFLIHLYKHWGLTKQNLLNTVVLFVSKSKKEVRLFVGKQISDDFSKLARQEILDHIVRPKIREGNYKTAIKKGMKAILNQI